ncbi:uncharacterized protein TNCV_4752861 [Trichonephila clavipes]|nr:uncharacterized protein TNCV_4752861 [Trichonephila clavipes]
MALSGSLPQINLGVQGKLEETRGNNRTWTLADHGESSINLRVKVLWIIRDSMVDAEVVNRIIDSTIQRLVRGIVLSRAILITMTPVDLPYVPVLLNETLVTALWDTGAEKSFISEEVYRKYFSYRSRQKTKDRVVTAQGAPCCHLGRVELQIRIREFQKTWEFHLLNNMQYQCILGIDFMNESN